MIKALINECLLFRTKDKVIRLIGAMMWVSIILTVIALKI